MQNPAASFRATCAVNPADDKHKLKDISSLSSNATFAHILNSLCALAKILEKIHSSGDSNKIYI